MEKQILQYINQLEGYKTAIKSLHWNASNMSEHNLWDDIAKAVADIQDNVSEMTQGIKGQFQLDALSPEKYQIKSKKQVLTDIINDTMTLLNALNDKEEYIGIKSELESFVGSMNKFKYLYNITMKEKKIKKVVNESIENYINKFCR